MSTFTITLFIVAVAVMYVGVEVLQQPRVTAAGAFLLGMLAVVVGAEVLRTGRAFFQGGGPQALRRRAESYTGLPARLWGLLFVVAGLMTMAGAVMAVADPQQPLQAFARLLGTRAGWGALLVAIGTALSFYGAIRLGGGGAATISSTALRVRDVGYRLFGAVCLLAGLALLTFGVMLVL